MVGATSPPVRLLASLLAGAAVSLAACGDDGPSQQGGGAAETVTLVTHDSFAVSDEVLDAFTAETGITVRVLPSGDAGAALNQAILTKDHPQGDVFFGVDNTFLTRALDEDLFVPYESPALATVDDEFLVDAEHRVTPVDYGDVCVNYDRSFYDEAGTEPPQTLDDLLDPAYRGQLVVENPATSSPGLAFLLATVAAYGDGWTGYWEDLRANGIEVAAGWEQAYYESFSGSAGSPGERPLVVSYASSPVAEVVFADEPLDEAPTGVAEGTCFRQVEFAGILRGTDHLAAAQQVIDFLLSRELQEDIPLNMFVFPVNRDAELPPAFVEHAVVPEHPYRVEPDEIARRRDELIRTWTDIVLR
jgi:thiamine transport system substrate-binding protein